MMATPPMVGVPALVRWPLRSVLADLLTDPLGPQPVDEQRGGDHGDEQGDAAGQEEVGHALPAPGRQNPRQRGPRHVDVVEGQHAAGDLLTASRGPCRRSPRRRRARAVASAARDGRGPVRLDRRPLGCHPRRPADHLVDDASGSSIRGLSEVTHGQVRQSGRRRAHQRPLVVIAVAAGAEDDEEAAAGELPGALERPGSRPSGVWA